MLNVQKTHYFSNTVHYGGPLCPASLQMLCFLQSPSFNKHSSDWATWPRTLWWPNVGNVTPLSIIACSAFKIKVKTVNNVLSFTISSSRERNRVAWQTQWWCCMCVHTSHGCEVNVSPSLTHTHTRDAALWPSLSLFSLYTQAHTHTRCCDVTLSLTHTNTTRKTPHLNSQ